MIASVLVVLVCAGMYGWSAPVLARSLSPAMATRLLVPAGMAVSTAVWFVLAVTAFTWIGQDAEIAELGPWSPQRVRALAPIAPGIAEIALGILAVVCVRTVLRLVARTRALLRIHRLCGGLGRPGAVVVVDSDVPDAFTTPEATGRIIVTSGMLATLTDDERAALVAHERSHLRHRHSWWILAAEVAAAANPFLSRTSQAVRHAVERWADEDAAVDVADRRLVARALARAALTRQAHTRALSAPSDSAATAAVGGDVPTRVQALMDPPTRHVRAGVAALVALLVVVTTAGAVVERQGEHLFEEATTTSAPHH
ncbi:M56 family metallopeptidase [Actinopolymorpha sp. NPDC004070]|uniref:M56 family metallopeptidase n=1 Tax=Actinopolymorpha sp. NPDC004070 TaxID=3154548 RepID=UPI0033B2679A